MLDRITRLLNDRIISNQIFSRTIPLPAIAISQFSNYQPNFDPHIRIGHLKVSVSQCGQVQRALKRNLCRLLELTIDRNRFLSLPCQREGIVRNNSQIRKTRNRSGRAPPNR